ncbi:MAG: hypothetical protein K1Y01_15825 [Vicinamibacteria bacterium]|nr:hypothetical protein [Vicinamibacteria bacterium]
MKRLAFGAGLLLLSGTAGAQSVNVIAEGPGAGVCVAPLGLPRDTDDINRQPQGEVWIDVSEGGRLAAAAKDYRFSPTADITYNNRVWNGLYVSADGASWKNFAFEDATPDTGVSGVTDGSYGRPRGTPLALTHESDPVVAYDRDGVLYTSALAFEPNAGGDPSAVVVSRRNPDGTFIQGSVRLLGLENDARLFNDKNWLAVDRDAPSDRTVVVASWRLFTVGADALAPEGGWIAISGDGAATFSTPIRLPVPAVQAAESQFYQPLLGRDPQNGHRMLYVILRTQSAANVIAMHVVKADIDGVSGTAALESRLKDPLAWTFLPSRLSGLTAYGASGYDGTFRFGSYFMPAIDAATGRLFAVVHALDPVSRRSQTLISRSTDGAATWSTPTPIDNPGRGNQLMPSVAARGGRVFAVWYDSRNDLEFAPLSPIRGVDVYAAVLDDSLTVQRVSRLTPEVQRADRPVFTRPRPVGATSTASERPHDFDPRTSGSNVVKAAANENCAIERYGFIGDYIGIAANADGAWAAWTDLRDLTESGDICAVGHSCAGNRNQSVHAVRIPR